METVTPLALIRRAAQSLRQVPGFAALCVVTLAVGIGAVIAVYSLVDAVLLRPLPVPAGDRLVVLEQAVPRLELPEAELSPGLFLFYRAHQHAFTGMALFNDGGDVNLSTGAEPVRVPAAAVTSSLFTVLRVGARRGRVFAAAEDRPGTPPVAVLSDALWRRQLGADPGVVGRMVRIDGVATEVIGVMPPEFAFPDLKTALWRPLRIDPANAPLGQLDFGGVGRLAAGSTAASAAVELNRLAASLDRYLTDPTAKVLVAGGLTVRVLPLRHLMVGNAGPAIWLVFGAVGFILAIACANVANLLIVRGEGRQRQLAIYTALGAPRRLLIGAVLAESLLIALAAGVAGLALAWGSVRLIMALRPVALATLAPPVIDGRVLAFAAAVSLAASVLFGLVPAWRSSRLADLASQLRGGGRAMTQGRGRQRLRQLLAGLQLALGMVLLTGSALMLRSFRHLAATDPGFAPASTLSFDLSLPEVAYRDDLAAVRLWHQLLDRIGALPGVVGVGATSALPLSSYSMGGHALADQPRPAAAPPARMGFKEVSEGFLRAMGIPLVAGRGLERADADRRTGAVVVSAGLARRYWPRGALGQRLRRGEIDKPGMPWYTVVGVAGDVHQRALTGDTADETVYYPLLAKLPGEWVARRLTLVVRTSVQPAALLPAIRGEIRRLAPDLPIANVRSLDEVVHGARSRIEFSALLVLVATAVALLLGVVGLYGFISYLVGQRTAEIGIRMALGATDRAIRWLVLREALLIAAAAAALGLAAAAALSGSLGALLVGVSPLDPLSFAAAPVLLILVTLLASYLPADRAAQVEPGVALQRLE
jgi:putative ABC transport system permease protein